MAGMPYRIVDVSNWRILSVEEMGSKPKFWVQDPDGPKWLFKHRHRPSVGDDWAEKIAAEVAEKLAIPHATVELARFEDKPGIISRDLVGTASPRELVLGNSLLVEADPTYPPTTGGTEQGNGASYEQDNDTTGGGPAMSWEAGACNHAARHAMICAE